MQEQDFLRTIQECYMTLIRSHQNHYWMEILDQILNNVSNFCSCGEKATDKVLRETMLVDYIIRDHVINPVKLKTQSGTLDMHVWHSLMELCSSLSETTEDWAKDRLIHNGIFNAILFLLKSQTLGDSSIN